MRVTWNGSLSFGLVSIPVDLYSGTRGGGVALRMLSPEGTPLQRRFYCPNDGEPVASDQLVRGYEHAPGNYVVITDEELEALEPDKSRDIDLRSFVAVQELDPVYFERSFYLVPTGSSTKAYQLLATVMESRGLAGIATFVMREREYLVAILAQDGLLRAQVLRFPDQVRSTDALELPAQGRVPAGEVERFVKVIRKHARADLDVEQLHDEYAEQLRKLAEKKAHSQKNVVRTAPEEEAASDAQIVDLMEVLQRSLQEHREGAEGGKRVSSSKRGKR